MAVPAGIAWSPDDSLVTYLHDPGGGLVRRLYALDPETGASREIGLAPPADEAQMSLEEQLRRERSRERAVGITSYRWAERGTRILVPIGGAAHVADGPGAPLRPVADNATDPRLSPDGSMLAFVRDSELQVVDASGGESRQLTFGAASKGVTHGLAEFIAQEEMGRSRGYWWSDDGSMIAFTQVDESHIPIYQIVHQGKDSVVVENHRYPFAGAANALVRLAVVPARRGDPVLMDLGPDEDVYLARVRFLPDGSLVAQVLNREQSRLDVLRLDPSTGASTPLVREESDVWINLHEVLEPLPDGSFVWASERSGFRHLELRAADGSLVRPLTSGEWMVTSLDRVAGELLLFSGTADGPEQRHLYETSLTSPGAPRRITTGTGMHAAVVDHAGTRFVDIWSSPSLAPRIDIRSAADSAALASVHPGSDPRIGELSLEQPELVTLRSRDGELLHGAVWAPAGAGPHPAIVSVYGGPHAQMVTSSWGMTAAMRAQYLRSRGFLVFTLDNRGSYGRGLRFEGAVKHDLGNLEVRDQVDGVRWLADRGLADPSRIGVYGWSYGGYMALMCLARAPETFRAAVAGAPVTHWDGYDTCYTERHMGTPASNPDGYARSSVMAHVDKIRGELLIVHGMIDENVHFRHTVRLINALNRARKPYELLPFPDERHMPRREQDRAFLESRVAAFLERALQPNANLMQT
jgi:dipeptidyl-peptidase-4